MNPQDQYLACAEMDEKLTTPEYIAANNYVGSGFAVFLGRNCQRELPDYNTYDALIPLIVKWCVNQEKHKKFIAELYELHTSPDGLDLTDAFGQQHNLIAFSLGFESTPSQLREALLKASGKWKE